MSIACFLAGRYFRRQGNDFLRNLTLEAEGESFAYQWIKSFFTEKSNKNNAEELAEDGISFAVWTELKNENVFEDFSGRSYNTDVIAVCGSSCNVLPFGKNLTIEDSSGCIIGKKLADQIPFDRISLPLEKGEDRRLKGENFISQYGISAYVLRLDYLGSLSWVSEMIPGKWSDFDGWKQNFKEHKKAEELAKNAKKSAIESVGLENWKKGNRLFCCAILFLIAAIEFGYYQYRHFLKNMESNMEVALKV